MKMPFICPSDMMIAPELTENGRDGGSGGLEREGDKKTIKDEL